MKMWKWLKIKLGIYTDAEHNARGINYANEFFDKGPCNDEIYYEYVSLLERSDGSHPFDKGIRYVFNQKMTEIEKINPIAFQLY